MLTKNTNDEPTGVAALNCKKSYIHNMKRVDTMAELCAIDSQYSSSSVPSLEMSTTTLSSGSYDFGQIHDQEEFSCVEENCFTKESQLAERARKREMTCRQEVWNAVTMLVTPITGLYFILSGRWQQSEMDYPLILDDIENSGKCMSLPWFPNMHSMPPLATLSVVLGYLIHSPCSIYYHLLCAFKLPPGPKRLDHWSRRLDQAMIHIMGLFITFGQSGNLNYSLVSLVFNVDSFYRLFQPVHRPKSIFIRMAINVLLSILPVLVYGHYVEVMQFLVIYAVAGWMFSKYPFGGYSHGFFHLVAALSNPIQLVLSTKLKTSQEAMEIAAKCAFLAKSA